MVYIPKGPDTLAENITHNTVSQIHLGKPQSAVVVLGDFNDPTFLISNFKQYVTFVTTNQRTTGLCFCIILNVYYDCYQKDPLRISDHNLLSSSKIIIYNQTQEGENNNNMKILDLDTVDTLKVCSGCTDWEIFVYSSESTEELVGTVSAYINFSEHNLVTSKM